MLSSLDSQELLRGGCLLIAFLVSMGSGRSFWLLVDNLSIFTFGILCVMWPKVFLGYQVSGQIEESHLYLAQFLGILLVSQSVMTYSSRTSGDPCAVTSILVSRSLSGMVLLHSIVFDHIKSEKQPMSWTKHHLSFGVLGVCLSTLGSLFYLLKAKFTTYSTITMNRRINVHLLINIIFLASLTLLGYGFPDMVYQMMQLNSGKPDLVHMHLIRASATMLLFELVHNLMALSFVKENIKQSVFSARLLAFSIIFIMLGYKIWLGQIFLRKLLIGSIIAAAVPISNAIFALNCHAIKYKVV